jgi:mercuric ion transport protein
MSPDRQLGFSLAGMIVAAVCCFTPALVILFALVGLSAVIGYVDYILLPALIGFALLAIGAYRKRRAACSRPKA